MKPPQTVPGRAVRSTRSNSEAPGTTKPSLTHGDLMPGTGPAVPGRLSEPARYSLSHRVTFILKTSHSVSSKEAASTHSTMMNTVCHI